MAHYYRSSVVSTGGDADEMFDGGVVILFGEPCPNELAEVSIVHRPTFVHPQRDPRTGDRLRVGDSMLTITGVGAIAGANLRELGHIVVYLNPDAGERVLPGAVHATGAFVPPASGAPIVLSANEDLTEGA